MATMRIKTTVLSIGIATLVALPCHSSFAADKETKATPAEKTFIMEAANGGMTEVDLGKVAAEKGGSEEVKDFGNLMVTDHSKINDQLKSVASEMGVTIPEKVNATHQAMIDKMSKLSGADFDKAYVPAMVKDHKKDIADFEAAEKHVKNAVLKKFIEDSVPVMKEHLEKIEKFDQAKK